MNAEQAGPISHNFLLVWFELFCMHNTINVLHSIIRFLYLSHSITFTKSFILVSIIIDLEPILGTLSMRWDCTLDWMPMHHGHCACTHTHSHLGSSYLSQSTYFSVFRKWGETHMNTIHKLHCDDEVVITSTNSN